MTKYAHIPKISYIWAYLIKVSTSDILRGVRVRPQGVAVVSMSHNFLCKRRQKKATCMFLRKPTTIIIFQLKQGRGTEPASGA